MNSICAWCGRTLADAPDPGSDGRWITHGICDECRDTLLGTMGIPLGEYLDSLPEPILLVDGKARVLDANAALRSSTREPGALPPGRLLGEVFECVHSAEPGGCGRTIHCSGCTIRRTVTDTFETGEGHLRVPATLTLSATGEPAPVQLLITTEKAGDHVLLRVDEAADRP